MQVYSFKYNKEKKTVEEGLEQVENKLEPIQKFVGGHIESLSITEDLVMIMNEEGKINDLTPTAALMDSDGEKILDIIYGDFFVCREDMGEMVDIVPAEDKEFIRAKLRPVQYVENIGIIFLRDEPTLK